MNKNPDARVITGLAGIVVLASTLLIGNGFAAQPSSVLPSVTVKFEDLNLNSTAGVAALYTRIHWAAKSVCALPGDDLSPDVRAAERRCATETEFTTINRMHIAALSAYFQQRAGNRSSVVAMTDAQ